MAEPQPQPPTQPPKPVVKSQQPVGTVKYTAVIVEIDGINHKWVVKELSYYKKTGVAQILSKLPKEEFKGLTSGAETSVSGEVAFDLLLYQFNILETNIVSTPDGTKVTRQYVEDLDEKVVNALWDGIAPDMEVAAKK